MKAGIIFAGSGPVLMMTSHKSFSDQKMIDKLEKKGIRKFICYEVPVDLVKKKYGNHFDLVMQDLRQEDDLRVIDFDGSHVFYGFSFKDMEKPFYHE
ncbi:MAG: hypothetical protein JXB00_08850 [Bacteroidales bacterium]|nr:hypothetical protein [Bacteroidales bacterium]